MPKFLAKNTTVSIPVRFIQEAMPKANAAFVKVYLYGLSLACQDKELEFSYIAQQLGLLESEVIQAFEYWRQEGELLFSDGIISYSGNLPERSQMPPAAPAPVQNTFHDPYAREKIDIDTMTRDIDADESLAAMFQIAQEILGKTITNADSETLYWFYKELGFRPEAILAILEYCVSMNKKNMPYIEKVAISLHERGIISVTDIDRFIADERTRKSYMHTLKQLFHINDRNLTNMEEEYLSTWHDSWGMSEEMIALAYEYCIMRTNKLSFPYMNGILNSWFAKNIHTIEEAEKDNTEHKNSVRPQEGNKNSGQTPEAFQNNALSNEELERLALEKLNQKPSNKQ